MAKNEFVNSFFISVIVGLPLSKLKVFIKIKRNAVGGVRADGFVVEHHHQQYYSILTICYTIQCVRKSNSSFPFS